MMPEITNYHRDRWQTLKLVIVECNLLKLVSSNLRFRLLFRKERILHSIYKQKHTKRTTKGAGPGKGRAGQCSPLWTCGWACLCPGQFLCNRKSGTGFGIELFPCDAGVLAAPQWLAQLSCTPDSPSCCCPCCGAPPWSRHYPPWLRPHGYLSHCLFDNPTPVR